MDIDTAIANVVKGHSTPTIGRGFPHEGQAGYIVYESEMPALVAAIKWAFAPHIERFVAGVDRLIAERERLAVTLGNERGEAREALDAAESILRYAPQISTNCNGTKPGMTTQHALGLVRDALAKLDAPPTEVAAPPAPRPVTDDEVRAALGLYRHDADPGASVRSMRAALEQFAKGREG